MRMRNDASIPASTVSSAPAIGTAGFEVRLVPAEQIESTVLPLWLKGMSDPEIIHHVQDRFEWLYGHNPTGRPCSWVVVDRGSQEVLGACSVVPHRLHVGDAVLRAGLLVDFIVDPRARVAGPAVALQRGVAEQSAQAGFDILFGYPNRKAWPILARAGYKAFGGTRLWARSLRADPPRVRRMLERHLESRLSAKSAHTLSATLAWPLAFVAQAGSRALETWQMMSHRAITGRLRRFDGQAPQLAYPPASMLRTDHSPEHLRWRFATHPTHDYRIFELHEGPVCIAWAVLRFYVESAEIQAAEWLTERSELPGVLWGYMARAVRKEGVQVLSVNLAGSTDVDRSLATNLFIERPDDRKVILRAVNSLTASLLTSLPSLSTGRGWQLFAGTLDI